MFIGSVVQAIWSIVFWNNDVLFIHHWTVAGLGAIILLCISLPALVIAVYKEDFRLLTL